MFSNWPLINQICNIRPTWWRCWPWPLSTFNLTSRWPHRSAVSNGNQLLHGRNQGVILLTQLPICSEKMSTLVIFNHNWPRKCSDQMKEGWRATSCIISTFCPWIKWIFWKISKLTFSHKAALNCNKKVFDQCQRSPFNYHDTKAAFKCTQNYLAHTWK